MSQSTSGPDYAYIFQLIMMCLSIAAYYRMFAINGMNGAIAFAPFYRQKVFGELVGRESDGQKAMIYSSFYVVFGVAMVITGMFFLLLGIGSSSSSGVASAAGIFALLCLASSIATIVFFVLYQIALFKTRSAYLEILGYETWIAVLWLFFPQFVEVYFWLYRADPIE